MSSVTNSTDLDDWLDVGTPSPTFPSLALDDVLHDVDLLDDSLSFLDGSDATSIFGINPSPPPPATLSYKTDPGISLVRLDTVSHQLVSLASKGGAPTAICESRGFMAVGASRGMVMIFNSQGRLETFFSSEPDSGSVSCLAFSADGKYLAAGFSRGEVKLFNIRRRVITRTMNDTVQPGRGVLQILYLDSSSDFLTLDSGGNVFEVRMKTTLTRRITHQVRCVFSGCNGEVVHMKSIPYNLLVLLTVTKVLIVSTKSGGSVLCAFPVKQFDPHPPLFDFHFQAEKKQRFFRICLCRGDKLTIFALYPDKFGTKQRVAALIRAVQLPFEAVSLSWINSGGIVLFDAEGESAYIDPEKETANRTLDEDLPIIFSTADFKGLATGGNVSAAMKCLAEFVCYQSVFRQGDSILILTHEGIYSVRANTELEQLAMYEQRDDRISPCLYLLDLFKGKIRPSFAVAGKLETLLSVAIQRLAICTVDGYKDGQICDLVSHFRKHIHILLHVCFQSKQSSVLFDFAWPRFERDALLRSVFLDSLDECVLDGALETAPPSLVSAYLSHLANEGHFSQLQAAICRFPIHSIDLHMVMTVCRQNGLYDGVIYVMNNALGDYISPLEEMIETVSKFSSHEVISDSEVEQGNRLLMYIQCCLLGQSYPFGTLPPEQLQKVPLDVFRCIISLRGKDGSASSEQYPYLRVLLQFDTQQFLHVIATCLDAPLFSSDDGRLQRLLDMIGIVCQSIGTIPTLTNFLLLVERVLESGKIIVPADALENCIRRLLSHPDLTPAAESSVVDVLRSVPHLDKELILRLASNPFRPKICSFVYFSERRFKEVIKALLKSGSQCKTEVFSTIRSILMQDLSSTEMGELSSYVKSIITDLCAIDSAQTAQLLIDSFSDFFKELNSTDEQQRTVNFPVLKAAFELRQSRNENQLSGDEKEDDHLFEICFQGLVRLKWSDEDLRDLLLFWLPLGSRSEYCLNIAAENDKPITSTVLLEARGFIDRACDLIFEQLLKYSEDVVKSVFWIDELLSLSARHPLEAAAGGWLMTAFGELTKKSQFADSDDFNGRLSLLVSRILSSSSRHADELFSCLLECQSFRNGTLQEHSPMINQMLAACGFENKMLNSIVNTMDVEICDLLENLRFQTARKVSPVLVTNSCIKCGSSAAKAYYVFSCGHVVHMDCDNGTRTCSCQTGSRRTPSQRNLSPLLRRAPRIEKRNIFKKWNEPLRLTPC